MKYILMVILSCFLSTSVYAIDLETLEEYAFTSKDNKFIQLRQKTADGDIAFLRCEENLAKHKSFRWNWRVHALSFLKSNNKKTKVTVFIRDYQEFLSPDSRGFTEWVFMDINFDGRVENYTKRYALVMQNKVVVIPNWPEGFINEDWYVIEQEELDRMFKSEIKYWVKKISGK